ncbi:hypothetical protein CVV43_05430 [Candidatus Saccharibacteria bacterium HGW-Saccharibacteria-1]|jgi:hypothetical protein|nr:MAG: hypothetical protein CVV43_05430 [Candidatus Saccharibacteria bacterium HGW-Saccharibacteria-1]
MNDRNIISDFRELDATDPVACDHFFEKWGAGQSLAKSHMPYERLEAYRHVLGICKKEDKDKYMVAHKGTAFFFCALSLFDLKYFESSIFYFTAALAEDRRRSGSVTLVDYIFTPAGQILSLNHSGKWARFTTDFIDAVRYFIEKFNTQYGTSHSIEDFVQKFVHPMLEDERYSIITSFYSFILDYKEKDRNLRLAGGAIDSTEPILVNLFKGALIFETILKHYYPRDDSGIRITTLGRFSKNSNFVADFSGVKLSIYTNALQDILDDIVDYSTKTTLETTARIRNTTGHKLTWDNVFEDPDNYTKLFEQEVFAILNVITAQW